MNRISRTVGTGPISKLRLLLQTKIWERENLPLNNSLITLEMLLFLGICEAEGKRLTVEGLRSSLAFNTLGAGIHMRRLQREGYIKLEQDRTDRRVMYILTTPRLDKVLAAYLEVLEGYVEQRPSMVQDKPSSADSQAP